MMEQALSSLKQKYDVVVIGCSAGGVEALKEILSPLPAEFRQPIIVVQHRSPDSPSILVKYFSDICRMQVVEPEDKEPIRSGVIYFAPANYHLLMAANFTFNLSVDEPVHYSRPSIDVLFSTAAKAVRERLVGVILSGANTDGTQGLKEIKESGGLTVVQDPHTTLHPQMPRSALEGHHPDFILSLNQISELLHALQ